MRFYFFQTMTVEREGVQKPTLRALPGQTFPDGTPVDTQLNVQAPKEPGSSPYGSRLDYPEGTIFCSTHLELNDTKNKSFYSVYDSALGESALSTPPDFHPVSPDPGFAYKDPAHKDDRMNAAFVMFQSFGEQEDGQGGTESTGLRPAGLVYSPEEKGKARGPIKDWLPAYTDQTQTEFELITIWMKRLLTGMGITTMARRPKLDPATIGALNKLYTCGESLDTIASKARFDNVYVDQQMDPAGLSTISTGPFGWYLDRLVDEHDNEKPCTALERNPDNTEQLAEAAFLLCTDINNMTGSEHKSENAKMQADLKKALGNGWSLNEILHPDVLTAKADPASLCAALANGTIPMPERTGVARGDTLLKKLMKDKKNAAPRDEDGFHVDELQWMVLLRNLYQKTNTLLKGPSGSGKTELIQRLCKQTGTPCTLIQMGAITDPTSQLVGMRDFENATTTRFEWADFALAIQRPGVIILDEINRCPANGTNILFNVLDGNRVLMAPEAKTGEQRNVKVNPDCVFFATANIGMEYSGTHPLDFAIQNRFMPVEINYLDQKTEQKILMSRCKIGKEDASNIAIVAKSIRTAARSNEIQHAVSTRETLMCASLVKDGFTCEEAMTLTFLPVFDEGDFGQSGASERDTVRAMIASRFNTK